MHVAHQDQLAFHLTGRGSSGGLEPIEGRGLLPALFAPYRDLAALRHDFPLVLTAGAPARSLSALFDDAVAGAGDDEAAQRLRGHARRLEAALRRAAIDTGAETLADAWEIAAERLTGEDLDLRESLARLRLALPRDGALAVCDRALPGRLLAHEWHERQHAKAERLGAVIGGLAARLDDILKADFATSAAGRTPGLLRAAMGKSLESSFDFDAMARLLAGAASAGGLDEGRRKRIEWLLSVLRTQRFAPLPGSGIAPYGFAFNDCGTAQHAWRERLPAAAELARAIAMARLEVAGEYNEARHDALFAGFGDGMAGQPGTDFPDYLVYLAEPDLTPDQAARVLQALGAGLPFKVLVQTDDLLEAGGGLSALGLLVRPLAATALGLGDVYVLQAGASQLYGQLPRVQAGLAHGGPALFSVYSGAGPGSASLPPYLLSAAAVESRAFPAFVYDPGAGSDWASRFSLDGNPQPGADWPLHPLGYEDAAHRRQGETVAFTLVDFLACDRRAAAHLARVVPSAWNDNLAPVEQALAQPATERERCLPSLFMADAEAGLHKVIADEALLRAARGCLGRWRSLQELGGVNNSHAARAVAAQQAAPVVVPVAAPAEAPAAAEPVETEKPAPGAPYIETARCSSCNECIRLNDRMFGYDANRQAAIIDPKAGSYRQLVEAAESCQVSVIHPGKPGNPNEPGLEELLKRAEPFL